jgi:hypothetical protein
MHVDVRMRDLVDEYGFDLEGLITLIESDIDLFEYRSKGCMAVPV